MNIALKLILDYLGLDNHLNWREAYREAYVNMDIISFISVGTHVSVKIWIIQFNSCLDITAVLNKHPWLDKDRSFYYGNLHDENFLPHLKTWFQTWLDQQEVQNA